jgi:hypothetical protein
MSGPFSANLSPPPGFGIRTRYTHEQFAAMIGARRVVVAAEITPRKAWNPPRSASAAHTASDSARRSDSKTAGLPATGVGCALTEIVTERLPLGTI